MPYNSLIDRTDVGALIPEDVSRTIIQGLPAASVALTSFRRATMSRAQQRLPVLSVLPVAYWVDGDTGLKQTTEQNWANKYLDARELAVIVPIPQAVLDDVDFDIWGEVRPPGRGLRGEDRRRRHLRHRLAGRLAGLHRRGGGRGGQRGRGGRVHR